MSELGRSARLPALGWSIRPDGGFRLSGHAGADHSDDEVGPVLERWARYLGLTEETEPLSPGVREFRGEISGLTVEVWGVVDRDAFEVGTPYSDEL